MKTTAFSSPRYLLMIALASGLTLSACRKNDNELSGDDKKESTDNITSVTSYDDMAIMMEEAIETGNVATFVSPGGCAVITVDTNSVTRSATIDFGSVNCLCLDNRYRRGSITGTWTGTFGSSGNTVAISFSSYAVNDNQLSGSVAITYDGQDGQGNWSVTFATSGTVQLASSAGAVTWNASLTRAQVSGASTPTVFTDDKYQITGTASGSLSTGKSFSATITSPLIRDYSCPQHITQGVISIDTGVGPDKVVDFGSGSCDGEVVVSISGIEYTIILN